MVSHQPDIGFLDFGCHSLQVRGWRLGQHVPWWSAHNSKVPKYFLSLDIAYSLFLITYLHLSVFCDHFQDPHFLLKQSLPNVFLVQGYLNQLSHFRLSYHLTGFWTWHFGSWAPVETDDMRIPMWNQNEILIWDDTQHSGNHIRIHAVTRINFSVWQRGENINLLVPCYFSSIWVICSLRVPKWLSFNTRTAGPAWACWACFRQGRFRWFASWTCSQHPRIQSSSWKVQTCVAHPLQNCCCRSYHAAIFSMLVLNPPLRTFQDSRPKNPKRALRVMRS